MTCCSSVLLLQRWPSVRSGSDSIDVTSARREMQQESVSLLRPLSPSPSFPLLLSLFPFPLSLFSLSPFLLPLSPFLFPSFLLLFLLFPPFPLPLSLSSSRCIFAARLRIVLFWSRHQWPPQDLSSRKNLELPARPRRADLHRLSPRQDGLCV